MRTADLDAITVDGFGTLLELESPVARLQDALEARSVRRARREVAEAFAAEARYYRPRSHLGHDAATLADLRHACVRVFLDRLTADVEPQSFVDDFIAALVFRPADGAVEALDRLRALDLRMAVVSNWDCSLPHTLGEIGLLRYFDAVVTSAEAGTPKPHVEPFRLALTTLDVEPAKTLHIGDESDDERGAAAAGMHFAPAPLARAVAGLT